MKGDKTFRPPGDCSGGTNGATLAQTPQGFRNISSRLLFLGLLTVRDALGDAHDSERRASKQFLSECTLLR